VGKIRKLNQIVGARHLVDEIVKLQEFAHLHRVHVFELLCITCQGDYGIFEELGEYQVVVLVGFRINWTGFDQ